MSWENAPMLMKLAASELIGKNGAQIWGVDYRGRLYTNYQMTPGGRWDGWMTNSWSFGGYPESVYELCASKQHEGEAQLWVVDYKGQLWAIRQDKQGNWLPWESNWHPLPGSAKLKKIASVWRGLHGAQLWGITDDKGILTSCSQAMPSGAWGAWGDWPNTPDRLLEVSACMQGDGKGVLFILDGEEQLWSCTQEKPGGNWGKWIGPNWEKAPKLRNIAAVETMVKKGGDTIHGACIWGITLDGRLIFNEQSRPSANWFGWSHGSFKDTLRGFEITAARQNNQSARVWVVSNDRILVSQQVDLNSSPPGWERFWTPDI